MEPTHALRHSNRQAHPSGPAPAPTAPELRPRRERLPPPRPEAAAPEPRTRLRASKARAKAAAPSHTRRIVEALTSDIVGQSILPGSKLTEQSLAQRFGVSRSIVRQALHQLEGAGLISLLPARGAFVRAPDASEAAQIRAALVLIEGDMAARLAGRRTAAQLDCLRQHVAAEALVLASGEVRRYRPLLIRFHGLLAEMADQPVWTELCTSLRARMALTPLGDLGPQAALDLHLAHGRIIAALETGEAQAARHALRLALTPPGGPDHGTDLDEAQHG